MSTEGYGLLGEPRPGRFPTIPDLSRGEEENNVCLTAGCVKAGKHQNCKVDQRSTLESFKKVGGIESGEF